MHIRSLQKSVAFFSLLGALAACNLAAATTITTTGVASVAIGPSADSVTLNASSFSTSIGTVPSTIDLQTGSFFIDDSGTLVQTIPFTLSEDVTIDGITKSIVFSFSNAVSTTADFLSLNAGAVTTFGGYSFQLIGLAATPTSNFGDNALTIRAQVSALPASVPEPGTTVLLGLGLLALIVGRRKSATD